MSIIGVVHLEICLPYILDEVRVLFEGFLMALLEEFCKGPSLFLSSAGMLFWRDV